MKINNIILTALFIAPGICSGATLSPQEALQRVTNDFAFRKVKSNSSINFNATTPIITKMTDNRAALYVFNTNDNDGFMVVSADTATPALLGYSDKGTLPESEAMLPDGFRYWLDFLTSRVEEARSNGDAAIYRINRPQRESIQPLCATKWDQDEPYNALCPEKCPTGCVATAMAQVMKYHSWPETGTGSHSYNCGSETLSSDFSEVAFKWGDMLDSYADNGYSAEQSEAVATLMAQAGISVEMQYGTMQSGATVTSIAPALGEYFRYDKGIINTIYRPHYSLNAWEETIYTNLKEYGPVIYNGMTDLGGGHSFVCDGYDTDGYFHINWGWGGMSDGYFLLDVLDPQEQGTGGYRHESGYCYEQGVIIGITPDREGNSKWRGHLISTAQMVIDQEKEYAVGDKTAVYVNGYNMIYNSGPGTLSADTELGLIFFSIQSDESFIKPVAVGEEVPMLAGMRGFYFPIADDLKDGDYIAYLVYRDNFNEWEKIPVPVFDSQDFMASVKDGMVKFTPSEYIRLEGADLEFPDEIYDIDVATKLKFPVACTITNPTDRSFYSYLQPLIITSDYEICGYGTKEIISLDAGESFSYEKETPFDRFHGDCGDYILVITTRTSYTYEIVAYKPIKIVSFYGDGGVEDIMDGADSHEPVYFDLSGSRINNPKPGTMVIEKNGNNYSKIIMSEF